MAKNYREMSTLKLYLFFIGGYIFFLIKDHTPYISYRSMRELFVRTNGKLNNFMALFSSFRKPKPIFTERESLFGSFTSKDINDAATNLNTNGFHIFNQKLDEPIVDTIVFHARSTLLNYIKPQPIKNSKLKIEYSEDLKYFDSKKPVSPRYFFNPSQILKFSSLQSLLFDPFILSVAQNYLKCEPVLDLFAMWWSAPFEGKATNETAQEYHFDMDRLRFLKFFIYLTDVTDKNGPHCYIENSHKSLPELFCEDRRFSNHEITQYYPGDKIHELYGKKGTLIAVDTRGLHRGKPLFEDERLIFQIEFATSLFGQKYPIIDGTMVHIKHHKCIKQHPFTYQLFKG